MRVWRSSMPNDFTQTMILLCLSTLISLGNFPPFSLCPQKHIDCCLKKVNCCYLHSPAALTGATPVYACTQHPTIEHSSGGNGPYYKHPQSNGRHRERFAKPRCWQKWRWPTTNIAIVKTLWKITICSIRCHKGKQKSVVQSMFVDLHPTRIWCNIIYIHIYDVIHNIYIYIHIYYISWQISILSSPMAPHT